MCYGKEYKILTEYYDTMRLKSSKPYYHENSIVFANLPGYYKINKMCKFTFFSWKMGNIKKNIFYKSPQNGQIGKLLLSVSTMETKSRSIQNVIYSVTMYLDMDLL